MIPVLVRETLRDVVVPIVVAAVGAYAVVKAAALAKPDAPKPEESPEGS